MHFFVDTSCKFIFVFQVAEGGFKVEMRASEACRNLNAFEKALDRLVSGTFTTLYARAQKGQRAEKKAKTQEAVLKRTAETPQWGTWLATTWRMA